MIGRGATISTQVPAYSLNPLAIAEDCSSIGTLGRQDRPNATPAGLNAATIYNVLEGHPSRRQIPMACTYAVVTGLVQVQSLAVPGALRVHQDGVRLHYSFRPSPLARSVTASAQLHSSPYTLHAELPATSSLASIPLRPSRQGASITIDGVP